MTDLYQCLNFPPLKDNYTYVHFHYGNGLCLNTFVECSKKTAQTFLQNIPLIDPFVCVVAIDFAAIWKELHEFDIKITDKLEIDHTSRTCTGYHSDFEDEIQTEEQLIKQYGFYPKWTRNSYGLICKDDTSLFWDIMTHTLQSVYNQIICSVSIYELKNTHITHMELIRDDKIYIYNFNVIQCHDVVRDNPSISYIGKDSEKIIEIVNVLCEVYREIIKDISNTTTTLICTGYGSVKKMLKEKKKAMKANKPGKKGKKSSKSFFGANFNKKN